MTRYRPCGACSQLVPADTGCEHWKPGARPRRGVASTRGGGTAPTVAQYLAEMETRQARG